MKRFRNYITEGSILDPKYVIGHKFVYKGNGFKELQDAGYKKDDVFEVVAFNKNAIDAGPQGGEFTKHFKAPDGKVYSISGGKGAKSGNFTHMATASKAPSGAEWEDIIVYAYNKINNKDTDPETTEVAMKFWSLYEDAAMTHRSLLFAILHMPTLLSPLALIATSEIRHKTPTVRKN